MFTCTDGKHLVSGSKAGELQCWDPQTGKPSGNQLMVKRSVICLSGHKLAVTCVKWGGDGIIYTGYVALQRYNKMKGNGPERLVSGSDDFTMFLWEPAVDKHPKTRLVNHVYFSPDGQWVASASFDKSVKLWNGITGQFIAAFRGSWSADSRLLLSGSKDSTLKVKVLIVYF
ncbi:Notchless protein homolog [Linum perenne]